MTGGIWRHWWNIAGAFVLNELPVADGIMLDGKFQNAQEQEPSAAGSPAIEPKREFVQVAVQVRRLDRALVPSSHRLTSASTLWTPGRSAPGSSPRAAAACWLRRT